MNAPKILNVCCDGSHLFHVDSCALAAVVLNTGAVLSAEFVGAIDRRPSLPELTVEDVATDAGGEGSVDDAPFR